MSVSPRMKRKISQPDRKGNSSLAIWLIGGAVIFVILLVIVINIVNSNNSLGSGGEVTQPDLPAEWIVGSSMGNPDAKVVVDAYEDFLCSHCLEWTTTIKPQLLENYIKPGKVRFVYHPFPLSGFAPGSNMAALASYCATDQNAFWPYHDRLFGAQRGGQGAFTLEKLTDYAAELGLNQSDFTSCLSSMKHQSAVDASLQEGVGKGVQGTPAIYINGNAINSDYPTIQAELDRLLQAAG
jgi:protein-disulfide isomerase